MIRGLSLLAVLGATLFPGQAGFASGQAAPIFYLKVWDNGGVMDYMLVDGLQYLAGGGENHLRVDGIYPLGTYVFHGITAVTITFSPP